MYQLCYMKMLLKWFYVYCLWVKSGIVKMPSNCRLSNRMQSLDNYPKRYIGADDLCNFIKYKLFYAQNRNTSFSFIR